MSGNYYDYSGGSYYDQINQPQRPLQQQYYSQQPYPANQQPGSANWSQEPSQNQQQQQQQQGQINQTNYAAPPYQQTSAYATPNGNGGAVTPPASMSSAASGSNLPLQQGPTNPAQGPWNPTQFYPHHGPIPVHVTTEARPQSTQSYPAGTPGGNTPGAPSPSLSRGASQLQRFHSVTGPSGDEQPHQALYANTMPARQRDPSVASSTSSSPSAVNTQATALEVERPESTFSLSTATTPTAVGAGTAGDQKQLALLMQKQQLLILQQQEKLEEIERKLVQREAENELMRRRLAEKENELNLAEQRMRHREARDIPEQGQRLVKRLYVGWYFNCLAYFINFLAAFALVTQKAEAGGTTFALSIVILVAGIPVGFVFWYRPLYKAVKTSNQMEYNFFLANYGIHLFISLILAIGVPGWGGAGAIYCVSMMTTNFGTAVLCAINTTCLLLEVVYGAWHLKSVYFYQAVHGEKALKGPKTPAIASSAAYDAKGSPVSPTTPNLDAKWSAPSKEDYAITVRDSTSTIVGTLPKS
ncbi:Secretory carrier-associated membrane protein 5 [Phlyctochytrium planicorne]|nr:Secretory carrier-associated membrane protein 5 [Phlyctochytrium planicorne]